MRINGYNGGLFREDPELDTLIIPDDEIEKFEEFGKLSNRKVDELESHRELAETTKKSEHDFALWKKRDGVDEPVFPSPWGDGRPGWHIEDTAITEYYFGEQYDVHGGGRL